LSRANWGFIILSVLVAVVWGYLYGDLQIANYFHDRSDSFIVHFFHKITIIGQSEYYIIPSLILYFYYKNRDMITAQKALFVLNSVVLSAVVAWVFKIIFGRFRPSFYFDDGRYGFDYFHLMHNLTSFPSGHSATVFSLAVAFSALFPRYRFAFWMIALMVALSRAVIVRHFFSDVVFGSFIGAVSAYYLYQFIYKKRFENV